MRPPKGFIACICDPDFVVAVELDSVPQCTELGVRLRRMGMLPRSIGTEGRPTGNYCTNWVDGPFKGKDMERPSQADASLHSGEIFRMILVNFKVNTHNKL